MKIKNQSYYSAIFYGLYMYLLYQIINFLRFGEFMISCPECEYGMTENILFLLTNHGAPYLIGVFSVLLLFYFAKKYNIEQKMLLTCFIIAIPFSFFFSLIGGLLGFFWVFLSGIFPVIISLMISLYISKKLHR